MTVKMTARTFLLCALFGMLPWAPFTFLLTDNVADTDNKWVMGRPLRTARRFCWREVSALTFAVVLLVVLGIISFHCFELNSVSESTKTQQIGMSLSSSSTLVNVAEDAELRLVRLLADAAPPQLLSPTFVQECEQCMVQADASALMRTIVGDAGAMAALFALEPLDEAVSAFSLLAALLDRVREDRPDAEADIAVALADAVINSQVDTPDAALRRITFLSTLYNIRSDGRERCALLARMMTLAAAHEPSMLVEGQALGNLLLEDTSAGEFGPSEPRIVSMVDAWNVPVEAKRGLYKAIADSIPDSPSRKQRFTLLLVDSYKEMSQVDDVGLAAAKEAAIGAIRDPVTLFIQQRGMLSMPAIQALDSQNDTKKLYGLLTIFQEGKLDDYNTYVKNNGGESAVLVPYGLSADDCVRFMRILSLCSLAAEHEEIPYSTIASTLQLPSQDEVESWVIAAVSSGLLVAKMDQLEQKVMVERAVVRKFDIEQWKALQSRLNLWKKNVSGILEGFKQTQAGAAPPSS